MLCFPLVPDGDTLPIPFFTSDSSGGLVAPSTALEAADVRIYKDGSATQRASESGYTMTSPFDSVTGFHMLTVDLSDNTDAGFYSVGSWFNVVLVPDETVDSQTVGGVIATFRIVPAEASSGVPDVNVASMDAGTVTAAAVATDAIDADALATDAINEINATVDTALADYDGPTKAEMDALIGTPAGADVSADIAAIKAETALIVADTNELQTDWADGGRLDLIQDELTSQGDTNETKLDTIDGVVDAILVDTVEIGVAGAGLTEAGGTGDHLTDIPIDADDLTAAACNKIADHTLGRSATNFEASTDGDKATDASLYGAISGGVPINKVTTSANGNTLTVYLADGTTVNYTRTLTRDRGAAPISGTE